MNSGSFGQYGQLPRGGIKMGECISKKYNLLYVICALNMLYIAFMHVQSIGNRYLPLGVKNKETTPESHFLFLIGWGHLNEGFAQGAIHARTTTGYQTEGFIYMHSGIKAGHRYLDPEIRL
ncbi:hypothetical protein AMECASPLE_036475 [Ameca splendens]|uniref:Uncharacterized protein n=1 Tax=Ameca splendens TaxID=208324 RepID=A0ABV0YV81_9TELE